MRIDSYEWSGGREAMLRFGPDRGPVVVIALPLFEEANRVRAFAVTMCRLLAKRDVASVLPDVPGQSESLLLTQEASLAAIRGGFAAAVEQLSGEGHRPYSGSIRSGAIVDTAARTLGRWSLSPAAGQQLLGELAKVLSAAKREGEAHDVRNGFSINQAGQTVEIAGNLTATTLLRELGTYAGAYPPHDGGIPLRVVRLDTDPGQAHRHVPGPPLWRRAEPGNDPALAAMLADDIADWIAACEG